VDRYWTVNIAEFAECAAVIFVDSLPVIDLSPGRGICPGGPCREVPLRSQRRQSPSFEWDNCNPQLIQKYGKTTFPIRRRSTMRAMSTCTASHVAVVRKGSDADVLWPLRKSRLMSGAGRVAAASSSHTFGRDEEFFRISTFLDAVSQGPRALLVEGEPGVGKTTLWRWALERAAAANYSAAAPGDTSPHEVTPGCEGRSTRGLR
jgi:hypothetical protein